MPSTLRLNLAVRSANNYVQENLDDLLQSQYGRHDTVVLPAATPVTVTWPTSGETMCYIRFFKQLAAVDVTLKWNAGDIGNVFTVPIGPVTDFVPYLIPKGKTVTSFILSATAALPLVDLFYF
jgi:hypothetical protein